MLHWDVSLNFFTLWILSNLRKNDENHLNYPLVSLFGSGEWQKLVV